MSLQADQLPLKPPSFPVEPVRVDFRKLLSSMGQALTHGTFAVLAPEPATASASAVNAGAAIFGAAEAFETDAPLGVRAWHLVRAGLADSLAQLLKEIHESKGPFAGDLELLEDRFDLLLESDEAVIDANFLENPRTLRLLPKLRNTLEGWLSTKVGLGDGEARSLCARLPAYLAPALLDESRQHFSYYEPIYRHFNDPFTPAARMEWDWERNRLALIKQMDEPVFEETFSLRQVYVPLRAYHEERPKSRSRGDLEIDHEPRRILHNLETAMMEWLEGKSGSTDAIWFVTGGPGSGKSTFAKHVAAQLSAEYRRVLFFELQDFDMEENIERAIGRYLGRREAFQENPLEQRGFASADHLLLVFDGLDELGQPGDYADRETSNFISRLDSALNGWNKSGRRRVLALITGRAPTIQFHTARLNLRERQLLWVLPYLISREAFRELKGSVTIIKRDQRVDWWERYANAKGLDRSAPPRRLLSPDLAELTAEPLLCYLVILSGFIGAATSDERPNRNRIYEELYKSVMKRRHAGGARLPAAKALDDETFDRLMEATAVAAWWDGEGRIASVEQIRNACGDDRALGEALRPFLEAGHKAARLFAAFYFRTADSRRHEGSAFEFTHKSFSEYLTARRLVREIQDIHQGIARVRNYEEKALQDWARLCGPAPLTLEILQFLRDEIALRAESGPGATAAAEWQQTLVELFNRELVDGFPLAALGAATGFRESEWRSRNAEEALLAALSACARATSNISRVKWPTVMSAGDLIHRLRGQRDGASSASVVLACLGWLELSFQSLHSQELVRADLSGASLDSARLHNINLEEAALGRVDLEEAVLSKANLKRADLGQASLGRAILNDVDLYEADLSGADLRGADLIAARLAKADLHGAYLAGANLIQADLREADLRGAELSGADFGGANLLRTDLRDANLRGADLTQSKNLTRDQIKSARDLTGAKLPDPMKNMEMCTGIPQTYSFTAPVIEET